MIGLSNFILWIVIATFGAICLFILVLLARLMLRRNARSYPMRSEAPRQTQRELAWTVTPLIVVAVVAVPLLRLLYFENTSPAADLTIDVTAKMWSWTYGYPDYGNFTFEAPMLLNNTAEKGREPNPPGTGNHIVVPVGKTVRIVTIGTNLIYSWAIPSIGAKSTALPGRTSQSWFKAAREGRYYGECDELCGLPHAFKPIEVEVVSPERFNRWVAEARSRLAAAGTPTRVADE
jgi:cytochrome c oxidase subunit II